MLLQEQSATVKTAKRTEASANVSQTSSDEIAQDARSDTTTGPTAENATALETQFVMRILENASAQQIPLKIASPARMMLMAIII